jgi:hypothetical protein
MLYTKIIIPINVKAKIINFNNSKKVLIIFTNNIMSIILKFLNSNIFFNKFLNIIYLRGFIFNKDSIYLKLLINDFNSIIFKKILFSGKGYKLETNKNKYYFFFNYSHLIMLNFKKIIPLRLKKNKFIILFLNKNNKNLINSIKNIRLINKYTQKGIKLSRLSFFTKNKKKK